MALWYVANLTDDLRTKTDDLSTKTNDLQVNSNALRRKNYAFAMESAFRAWQVGSLAQLQEILVSQVPSANDEDLRGVEWRFLDARCKENLQDPLLQTASPILSLAFSPKGTHLAIVLSKGELLLHNLITGCTDTLNDGNDLGGLKLGTNVAFAPSGDFLVGLGQSCLEVYVWRVSPDNAAGFAQ